MADLDDSKKRFDETLRRLEALVNAAAAQPRLTPRTANRGEDVSLTGSDGDVPDGGVPNGGGDVDGDVDGSGGQLLHENAQLRAQLASIRQDNKALRASVAEMSAKVESIVKKLDQVLEASNATA